MCWVSLCLCLLSFVVIAVQNDISLLLDFWESSTLWWLQVLQLFTDREKQDLMYSSVCPVPCVLQFLSLFSLLRYLGAVLWSDWIKRSYGHLNSQKMIVNVVSVYTSGCASKTGQTGVSHGAWAELQLPLWFPTLLHPLRSQQAGGSGCSAGTMQAQCGNLTYTSTYMHSMLNSTTTKTCI